METFLHVIATYLFKNDYFDPSVNGGILIKILDSVVTIWSYLFRF